MVAAHKVRYWVRHFGEVFTFPGIRGRISVLGAIGRSMARAARDFFKDFDVLAPEISKFLLARRGLGGLWCREWPGDRATVGTNVES